MNKKDIKTFHVAQDGQEIGVIMKNSQNARTAAASDNVNQCPAYDQAVPQGSNVNQLPVYGQAVPQSSNVNQLPVYDQAAPQSSNVNQVTVGRDQNEDHMAEKGERENTDVCPTCKETFGDHEMQIHLRKCKKSSSHKQGNIKCTYCRQQFNKEYVLDRHLISKHPDKNAVKKMLQQKIPCADCDETFQSDSLRIHHRVTAHKIKEKKDRDICV